VVLLKGWANTREGWLEETIWNALVSSLDFRDKYDDTNSFGNITLLISKWIYMGVTHLYL